MARALGVSGWTTYAVPDESHSSVTVITMAGVNTTVHITRTFLLSAIAAHLLTVTEHFVVIWATIFMLLPT